MSLYKSRDKKLRSSLEGSKNPWGRAEEKPHQEGDAYISDAMLALKD